MDGDCALLHTQNLGKTRHFQKGGEREKGEKCNEFQLYLTDKYSEVNPKKRKKFKILMRYHSVREL